MTSVARPPVQSAKDFLLTGLAHIPEATLTTARPLGERELAQVLSRRSRGLNDFQFLVSLDIGPTDLQLIAEENVVLAFAIVRIRHPLLASRVSFSGGLPTFVCDSPLTQRHAIEEAQNAIQFGTFDNTDEQLAAMQSRFLRGNPQDLLDVRQATLGIHWLQGFGPALGRCILGVQNIHAVADARHVLHGMREFLQLLCEPGRAGAELADHFSRPLEPLRIPEYIDGTTQDTPSADATELAKNDPVYIDTMQAATQERLGVKADGTPAEDKVHFTTILHRWPSTEAGPILQVCRAHGTTITHLSMAALALAAASSEENLSRDDHVTEPSQSQSHHLMMLTAVDLTRQLQALAGAEGFDTATCVGTVPIMLALPRELETKSENALIWEMAQQCKDRLAAFRASPFFLQLLTLTRPMVIQNYFDLLGGRPSLPVVSSIGECTQILPSRFKIASPADASESPELHTEADGGEVCVRDLLFVGKFTYPSFHLWTYDGTMYLQATYNSAHLSPQIMEPLFQRTVDMITHAGTDDGYGFLSPHSASERLGHVPSVRGPASGR